MQTFHSGSAQTASLSAPVPFNRTLPGKAVLAVGASLFVAACAHLSVPLPFTPVPLTLADLAVLLVGLSLGPSIGFAALVLYLIEGASGMPVFSPAGPGGVAQLLGPTGGFLLSYPMAAALCGVLAQDLRRATSTIVSTFTTHVLAAAAGSTLLMLCGVVWLGWELHLSPMSAFGKGAAPFLPGQVIKVLAAAGIISTLRRTQTGSTAGNRDR